MTSCLYQDCPWPPQLLVTWSVPDVGRWVFYACGMHIRHVCDLTAEHVPGAATLRLESIPPEADPGSHRA